MKKSVLLLVIFLLVTIIYCENIPNDIWKLDIGDTNIKTLLNYNLPVILDFGADWCGPCRQFHPILEKFNEKYKGQAIIKYVDIDKYSELANEYRVQYIPYQVFILSNGSKYFTNNYGLKSNDKWTYHVGGFSESQLDSIIDDMIDIKKKNDNNFSLNINNLNDIIGLGLPVILDFGADWCEPCRQFHPILQKVCEKYKGKAFIKYIDVDKNPKLLNEFSIEVIPTQIFILGNGQQYISINNPYGLKANNKFTYHQGVLSESQIDFIIKEMNYIFDNIKNN